MAVTVLTLVTQTRWTEIQYSLLRSKRMEPTEHWKRLRKRKFHSALLQLEPASSFASATTLWMTCTSSTRQFRQAKHAGNSFRKCCGANLALARELVRTIPVS